MTLSESIMIALFNGVGWALIGVGLGLFLAHALRRRP